MLTTVDVVNTNRGTAYILYKDTTDAEAAIAHMHDGQIDGAVINVSIVLPRRRFSRSPPPSRRLAAHQERIDNRGSHGGYRGAPPNSGRFRSPRHVSPPRRYGRERPDRDRNMDTYRPRSYSRSRSPRRSRSRSYSSRSPSRTPPRRGGGRVGRGGFEGGFRRRDDSPGRTGGAGGRGGARRSRRSPSYSSYSSYSRSRSRSRSRDRGARGRR